MSEPLRSWIREHDLTVAEFAQRLGKPRKTVEDWVYRGKVPSQRNRDLVYSVTGLAEFETPGEQLTRSGIGRAKRAPTPSSEEAGTGQLVSLLATELKGHLTSAESILHFFTKASPTLRDTLRSHLDPKEIAYFSALVRAILSDERLREFEIAVGVANSLRRGHGRG